MKRIIIASLLIGLLLSVTAIGNRRPVGVHFDLGDLSNNLMMQPNLEVGFGDNATTVAPTFELDYRFRSDWGAWTPYLGGGAGPVFYSTKHGNSSSKLGIYLQFGIGKGSSGSQSGHFFIEGKLGLADAPDFKATVGWIFGH